MTLGLLDLIYPTMEFMVKKAIDNQTTSIIAIPVSTNPEINAQSYDFS